MKKSKNKIINRPNLKRKKNQILIFDIYITKINSISITNNNSISSLKITEFNNIIYLLPPYLRKKTKSKFESLSIDKNISNEFFISNKEHLEQLNQEKQKNISMINQKNILLNKMRKKNNSTNIKNIEINKVKSEKKEENSNYIENFDEKKEENVENINLIINNNRFQELVKQPLPLNKKDVQRVEVMGDGNCLYRCISHFLLNSENYYNDIKNEIINWIDNNRKQFNEFFGDDELHKITKEKLADDEYNYIKKRILGVDLLP